MAQASLYSQHDYPPALSPAQQDSLLQQIKDWSIAHGLAVRPPAAYADQDPDANLAGSAPVTLFPSLFPRRCFEEALAIQRHYNQAYAAIARDTDWLGGVVRELVGVDDFIARLWNVHETVVSQGGYVQPLALGLFRSDYMVHVGALSQGSGAPQIHQVEFNTIASSFGGLASLVSSLHRHFGQTSIYPDETDSLYAPENLPRNKSIQGLAAGLASAHRAYGPSKSGHQLAVVFIVQDKERNVFDQRHIEYSLIDQLDAGARVFRVPLSQVLQQTRLDEARNLIYTPPAFPDRAYEVTTVYLRAGYTPDDYPSDEAWQARLHLEQSAAIKCPNILTHLAGSKKVQQILATPQSRHLEQFLGATEAAQVRNTFAAMYPLDDTPAGQEGQRLATDPDSAQRFVLKPQREGGGNNIYRGAIPGFLEKLGREKWSAYVLMEMIETPPQRNTILRNGQIAAGGVICELGVYGSIVWNMDSGQVLSNDEAGYLLRTKGDQSEEGGVAAGFGAVDSVVLVDV